MWEFMQQSRIEAQELTKTCVCQRPNCQAPLMHIFGLQTVDPDLTLALFKM